MVAGYVYGNNYDRVRYINPPLTAVPGNGPASSPSPTPSLGSAEKEIRASAEKEISPTKKGGGFEYPTSPSSAAWTSAPPAPGDENTSTQKERLRHIIVGTCLCMIIAEKEKRDTIREIILLLVTEGAGNG